MRLEIGVSKPSSRRPCFPNMMHFYASANDDISPLQTRASGQDVSDPFAARSMGPWGCFATP